MSAGCTIGPIIVRWSICCTVTIDITQNLKITKQYRYLTCIEIKVYAIQAEEDGGEAVQDSFLYVDRHAAQHVSRRRASQTLSLQSRPQRLRKACGANKKRLESINACGPTGYIKQI